MAAPASSIGAGRPPRLGDRDEFLCRDGSISMTTYAAAMPVESSPSAACSQTSFRAAPPGPRKIERDIIRYLDSHGKSCFARALPPPFGDKSPPTVDAAAASSSSGTRAPSVADRGRCPRRGGSGHLVVAAVRTSSTGVRTSGGTHQHRLVAGLDQHRATTMPPFGRWSGSR